MSVSNTVVPVAATWSHPRSTLGSSEQHLKNDQEFTLKVNLRFTYGAPQHTTIHTALAHQSRCREAGSAVLKDLIELPSTGTRETYATVQTYHTCGCRDNPHQPMAPRRRGSRVPSLRSVLMQPTLLGEYLFVLGS